MASVSSHAVGIRFVFDRHRRVTSPSFAALRRKVTEVWGLRNVAFSIGPGEGVALLGATGAGKTTLLRTLAGVYTPDAGRVDVRGRVGALLSTEAGLVPTLTGRENAHLLGVLSGLSRTEARAGLAQIKERSGLDDAFERPVSSYSQGMQARLGFSVIERAHPDILLLDEIHEAVDHAFRTLVERRAQAVVSGGGIVVATGHDHHLLERLCERALLFESGELVCDGPFLDVQRRYLG
jgi:ABC-type polysaccharide/polyol phosphate transport system ATPase subunit